MDWIYERLDELVKNGEMTEEEAIIIKDEILKKEGSLYIGNTILVRNGKNKSSGSNSRPKTDLVNY